MSKEASWAFRPVTCTQCSAGLMRRGLRPLDGKPIHHFFCNNACKGAWQRAQNPYSEGWLRQKYLIEGLSAPDIAKIVGRNSKGVWTWLRGYGIPTRPRGVNKEVHFKVGEVGGFAGNKHSEVTKAKLAAARHADGHFPKDQGRPYWLGKTGSQHPSWNGGHTPERQAFYATRKWKDACKGVWYRADAKCERCQLDSRSFSMKDRRFAVHHVVSFKVTALRAELSNLVLLCRCCHLHIHSKANTTSEFIRIAA